MRQMIRYALLDITSTLIVSSEAQVTVLFYLRFFRGQILLLTKLKQSTLFVLIHFKLNLVNFRPLTAFNET